MGRLSEFIKGDFLKYAVIRRVDYEGNDVAKQISTTPASVGDDHIILSIPIAKAADFSSYALSAGYEFEYEFVIDSDKISLLTHNQARELMAKYRVDES